MAQPTTVSEIPLQPADAAQPLLLSRLTRWWSPATSTPAAEPVLGYESAQPWTLFGGLVETRQAD